MTLVIEKIFPRTLDALVSQFRTASLQGGRLEAWVFDDAADRANAQAALKANGIEAIIRSAYKPLVHFFLEEVERPGDIVSVRIGYPVIEGIERRFLLESYPLSALLDGAEITFDAGTAVPFTYDVAIAYRDGSKVEKQVFAPNRSHIDPAGEDATSPAGWLRVTKGAEIITDEALETDIESLFHTAITAIENHDWGQTEPYFEELSIRAEIATRDVPLACRHETLSLAEALHEDLYFSLLEIFQKKSARPRGDRGLKPGQIVPEILHNSGALSLRIETRPLDVADRDMPKADIDTAPHALSVAQIRAELDAIGGQALSAQSRGGRRLDARYVAGSDPAVIISGGQHANETSGIVGALRAARQLAKQPGAHFVISPLENPDGYALHGRLTALHKSHMHHAARYTGFGNDLEYEPDAVGGKPGYERAIRTQSQTVSGAQLHVNLHGYPAHEWTRPFSGYVPRGFEMWTIPKGFFLIMRHHADWQRQAELLIDRVTAHLSTNRKLLDFNAEQIALFTRHAGEAGFTMVNGFPCLISVDDRHQTPLTLITEYPDETIEGDAFIDAHTAQMETVLGAYAAWQEIVAAAD